MLNIKFVMLHKGVSFYAYKRSRFLPYRFLLKELFSRVGHRVLLRSERIVLLCSFKEYNVLLRSFLKFLATYETQKNDAFFS